MAARNVKMRDGDKRKCSIKVRHFVDERRLRLKCASCPVESPNSEEFSQHILLEGHRAHAGVWRCGKCLDAKGQDRPEPFSNMDPQVVYQHVRDSHYCPKTGKFH